jgi:hypothetical protein
MSSVYVLALLHVDSGLCYWRRETHGHDQTINHPRLEGVEVCYYHSQHAN